MAAAFGVARRDVSGPLPGPVSGPMYGPLSGPVALHARRLNSGTMRLDSSSSGHFFAKYNLASASSFMGAGDGDAQNSASGGVRVKKLTPLPGEGGTRFPKLEECAHFHYEVVELGKIEVSLLEDNLELDGQSEQWLYFHVQSGLRDWTIRRTYESLHAMDAQLHRCIYDRRYSLLPPLDRDLVEEEGPIRALGKVAAYLARFSLLASSVINCSPVLSWIEMDNRGNRLLVSDTDAAINTPAVGAAHAIRRYTAQTQDELSFEVGDMLSIIDRPPPTESAWWRGKKSFEVGFFPSECVEEICDKNIPATVGAKLPSRPTSPKPVLRRKGKLIALLRTFFSSRPPRSALKRTGIVRERVFGCDLGEHLLNSGHDVPLVLKTCAEVIEEHGIVDGIYRLSGVASNIQRLRNAFDEDLVPVLTDPLYLQDIHSISSLLKMYFRDLPNPLFTYQLYDKFTEVIHESDADARLVSMRCVVQQLPPPHYRTAQFLLRHLAHIASLPRETSMNCRNLAIVWAPNLLRSKDLDQLQFGTAALHGVGLQAIVTEFLIIHVSDIFVNSPATPDPAPPVTLDLLGSAAHAPGGDASPAVFPSEGRGSVRSMPPRSPPLRIISPSKLLSLEEARERVLAGGGSRGAQRYIDVGGGPAALPLYHTVIDLPKDRKGRRSGWRSLFSRSRSASLKDDSEDTVETASGRFAVERSIAEEERTPVSSKKMRSAGPLTSTASYVCSADPITSAATCTDSTDCIELWRDDKRRSISCDIPCVPVDNLRTASGCNSLLEDSGQSLQGLSRKRSLGKYRTASVDVPPTDLRALLPPSRLHTPILPPPRHSDVVALAFDAAVAMAATPKLSPRSDPARLSTFSRRSVIRLGGPGATEGAGGATEPAICALPMQFSQSCTPVELNSPPSHLPSLLPGGGQLEDSGASEDLLDLESVVIPPPEDGGATRGDLEEEPSPPRTPLSPARSLSGAVFSPPPGMYIATTPPVEINSEPPTPVYLAAPRGPPAKSPLFIVRRKLSTSQSYGGTEGGISGASSTATVAPSNRLLSSSSSSGAVEEDDLLSWRLSGSLQSDQLVTELTSTLDRRLGCGEGLREGPNSGHTARSMGGTGLTGVTAASTYWNGNQLTRKTETEFRGCDVNVSRGSFSRSGATAGVEGDSYPLLRSAVAPSTSGGTRRSGVIKPSHHSTTASSDSHSSVVTRGSVPSAEAQGGGATRPPTGGRLSTSVSWPPPTDGGQQGALSSRQSAAVRPGYDKPVQIVKPVQSGTKKSSVSETLSTGALDKDHGFDDIRRLSLKGRSKLGAGRAPVPVSVSLGGPTSDPVSLPPSNSWAAKESRRKTDDEGVHRRSVKDLKTAFGTDGMAARVAGGPSSLISGPGAGLQGPEAGVPGPKDSTLLPFMVTTRSSGTADKNVFAGESARRDREPVKHGAPSGKQERTGKENEGVPSRANLSRASIGQIGRAASVTDPTSSTHAQVTRASVGRVDNSEPSNRESRMESGGRGLVADKRKSFLQRRADSDCSGVIESRSATQTSSGVTQQAISAATNQRPPGAVELRRVGARHEGGMGGGRMSEQGSQRGGGGGGEAGGASKGKFTTRASVQSAALPSNLLNSDPLVTFMSRSSVVSKTAEVRSARHEVRCGEGVQGKGEGWRGAERVDSFMALKERRKLFETVSG